MKKRAFLILLITLFISSCTLFKKEIHKNVTVFIQSYPTVPTYNTSEFVVKYFGNVSDDAICEGFSKNFIAEAERTNNVTIVKTEEEAQFTLSLLSFEITESSKNETINDDKSPFNGQQIVLTTIDCTASYKLIDNSNKNKNLSACSNTKSRSEKLKNNRDVGDLVFGSNKDKTQYRTKLLSDDIYLTLAEDVGRRIWVPITKRISKNL
jgi:hypothetical protein